jgi:hypothetical protein
VESKSPPSQDSQEPIKEAEGWDTEDWGSLEEVSNKFITFQSL